MSPKVRAKVITFPYFQALKYEKYILKLLRDIKKDIKVALMSFFTVHKDDYIDDLNRLFDDIRSSIALNEDLIISNLISRGKSILGFSRKQLIASLSGLISFKGISTLEDDIGINTFQSFNLSQNELLKSWVSTNTRLITSINEDLLNDVATIIESSFRAANSIDYIQDQIKTRFNVSDKKARLIARDQTAKLHSNYIKKEHLDLGITEYIWLTSNDERVRASHKVLNNKICQWMDATLYKNEDSSNWLHKSSIGGVNLQVGEDFQCRCSIKALINL